MGVGAIVGGIIAGASALYGSNQAKKQAEKQAAAAERTRLASATVQAVDVKSTVDASEGEQVSETAAASKKKRRFSLSKTVNNAGMSAGLMGKSTLG